MALRGLTNAEKIWNFLLDKGLNKLGASAVLGNLDAESALNPYNIEDYYQRKLGITDSEYVKNIDNGAYTRDQFSNDRIGAFLAQWTWHTRKRALYDFWKASGATSISDLEMQLNFLWYELTTSYKSLLNILKNATSIGEASNAFMMQYECPANAESLKAKRIAMSNTYYQRFVNGQAATSSRLLVYGCEGEDVKELQNKLIKLGYSCGSLGADGDYGPSTLQAVKKFQRDNGLKADGIAGSDTIAKLNKLYKSVDDSAVKVVIVASALNVRAGAGTNHRAIAYVRKGAVCELLEEKGIWGKIKQPEGWICMDYVQKI